MNFPEELKYTQEHEWIKLEGSYALVGITEFAQKELGDIVFLDIDTVGETINEGEIFGTIEAVKTVSDLFMPVTGEVMEVNKGLDNNPEFINSDPYGKGWILKLTMKDNGDINKLLSAEDYKKLIGL